MSTIYGAIVQRPYSGPPLDDTAPWADSDRYFSDRTDYLEYVNDYIEIPA